LPATGVDSAGGVGAFKKLAVENIRHAAGVACEFYRDFRIPQFYAVLFLILILAVGANSLMSRLGRRSSARPATVWTMDRLGTPAYAPGPAK
jgi:hypothetical protein